MCGVTAPACRSVRALPRATPRSIQRPAAPRRAWCWTLCSTVRAACRSSRSSLSAIIRAVRAAGLAVSRADPAVPMVLAAAPAAPVALAVVVRMVPAPAVVPTCPAARAPADWVRLVLAVDLWADRVAAPLAWDLRDREADRWDREADPAADREAAAQVGAKNHRRQITRPLALTVLLDADRRIAVDPHLVVAVLFHHLAAQLAAGVCRGMDVRIPLAREQIRRLIVGQGCRPLDRTFDGLERQHDSGILARLARPVEMRAHRRARQTRIGHRPGELLGVGIKCRLCGSRRRAGVRRYLVGALHVGVQ